MRLRWLPSLLVLGLAALPALAQKDPPKPATEAPTLVVRFAPIDKLLSDAKYLGSFTRFDDQVRQSLGIVEGLADKTKGINGIDPKKPIGLYAYAKDDITQSEFVLMLPVADQKAFLEALKGFSLEPKEEKGLYKLDLPNVPEQAMFRFANDYCYVTARQESALDKAKLADPAKMLPAGQGLMTTTFRIDQIPKDYKQLALQQLDLFLANALEQGGTGTEAQKALTKEMFKEFAGLVKEVLVSGEEVAFKLDVDQKTQTLSAELSLGGKADSKLGALFTKLGKAESVFGSFGGKDSAFLLLLNLAVPADMLKSFNAVIDESLKEALKNESDAKRKAQAEKVLKAIEPTLRAGELDVAVDLRRGKDAKFLTAVVGAKVKDGAALEKTFKELVKELPADDQKRLKLDVDQAGGVKIHQAEIKDLDEKTRQVYGEGPAYFAVRGDAVVAALGDNALSALKEVLASKPKASPQAKFVMGMQAMAPILAQVPQYDKETVEKAAKEAFEKAKDADKISLVVEGGKTLKLRFEMNAPVIKFFDLMQPK
jgi:hypothetical protein